MRLRIGLASGLPIQPREQHKFKHLSSPSAFADAGLELLVRYPVEIRRAPEIDDEMTRKVLELIETDAALKAAVSGSPKIRTAVKG